MPRNTKRSPYLSEAPIVLGNYLCVVRTMPHIPHAFLRIERRDNRIKHPFFDQEDPDFDDVNFPVDVEDSNLDNSFAWTCRSQNINTIMNDFKKVIAWIERT